MNADCAQALANPAERWICLELLVPPFLSKRKGGKQTREKKGQTKTTPFLNPQTTSANQPQEMTLIKSGL